MHTDDKKTIDNHMIPWLIVFLGLWVQVKSKWLLSKVSILSKDENHPGSVGNYKSYHSEERQPES